MAVIWGLDLHEMQWWKFKGSYMFNRDYHLRRSKMIVYQCAMILCVVSESLGTAMLSGVHWALLQTSWVWILMLRRLCITTKICAETCSWGFGLQQRLRRYCLVQHLRRNCHRNYFRRRLFLRSILAREIWEPSSKAFLEDFLGRRYLDGSCGCDRLYCTYPIFQSSSTWGYDERIDSNLVLFTRDYDNNSFCHYYWAPFYNFLAVIFTI